VRLTGRMVAGDGVDGVRWPPGRRGRRPGRPVSRVRR